MAKLCPVIFILQELKTYENVACALMQGGQNKWMSSNEIAPEHKAYAYLIGNRDITKRYSKQTFFVPRKLWAKLRTFINKSSV